MPVAATDGARRRWRTKRHGKGKGKGPYLLNHKALARVLRAKMPAAISAAGLSLPERHPVGWVVDCKSAGTRRKGAHLPRSLSLPLTGVKPRAPIICGCCGAVMTIVRTRIRSVFPVPGSPAAGSAC